MTGVPCRPRPNLRLGVRVVADTGERGRSVTPRHDAVPTGPPCAPDSWGAIVVVDHLHVVQLANKMFSQIRRHTTAELRGVLIGGLR